MIWRSIPGALFSCPFSAKEVFNLETKCEFQPGDVVRFKDYKQLCAEYGDGREIRCIPHGWSPRMRELCGMVFTIGRIRETFSSPVVYPEERGTSLDNWTIGAEMIEHYDSGFEIVVDSDQWSSMLQL